jgi:hypothetical protein
MGTNCAFLLVELFLYSYETEFSYNSEHICCCDFQLHYIATTFFFTMTSFIHRLIWSHWTWNNLAYVQVWNRGEQIDIGEDLLSSLLSAFWKWYDSHLVRKIQHSVGVKCCLICLNPRFVHWFCLQINHFTWTRNRTQGECCWSIWNVLSSLTSDPTYGTSRGPCLYNSLISISYRIYKIGAPPYISHWICIPLEISQGDCFWNWPTIFQTDHYVWANLQFCCLPKYYKVIDKCTWITIFACTVCFFY